MSAQTIARWNAIPLERPDPDTSGTNPMKRTRDDGDDESEDNVSLVSRSPSPVSPEAMEIDKYDEYVRGYEKEVITVETKIKPTNKGFAMLAKLGWVEGQPLGLSGDGRVDPIPFAVKNDMTGLGKANQDVRMIETTVSQRRELDSEKQIKETEEQRRARENTVAKRAEVQSEIKTTLRAFYCELCDKQFKNVAQYDEHTNSYAHHHKARFRDMQASQKIVVGSKEEVDKRKEKERLREEKELRKIAKAAGIRMSKPATTSGIASPSPISESTLESKPSGFKKPGWAAVSDGGLTAGPSDLKQSGWTSVGPSTSTNRNWGAVGPSQVPPPPATTTSIPASVTHTGPPPAFRTGGWTSLEGTGTSPLPPKALATSVPPVQAASVSEDRWSSVPAAPPSHGSMSISPPTQQSPSVTIPSSDTPSLGVPSSAPREKPHSSQKAKAAAKQESSRSGWQQFRAGGSRRR